MGWKFTNRDVKRYPHFDKFISAAELQEYVESPESVASNAFFPFLEYKEEWMPFGERGVTRKVKSRPIRYAEERIQQYSNIIDTY